MVDCYNHNVLGWWGYKLNNAHRYHSYDVPPQGVGI